MPAMRLICPNCDAQYEVDAAMIPASGRDVQCSNCGKTWFQGPDESGAVRVPDPETQTEPETAPDAAQDRSGDGLGDEAAAFFGKTSPSDAPEDAAEPAHKADAAPEPAEEAEDVESEAEDAPEANVAPPDDAEEPDEEEVPAPIRERPPIDPSVLGILRAEAEREIAARRAEEAAGIETQGDLGLDEAEPEPEARSDTEVRTARLRGLDEDGDAHETRNAILPDIEDINASLTATSDRGLPDTPAEMAEQLQKRRSGFRAGFSVVMAAVAAIIVVYLFAPQIARTIPALEPALSAYVDWANGMRLAIDGAMDRTATSLNGG